MKCPPRIAALLLELIRVGILSARAASWARDLHRCEAETDHIHNLPDLLLDFSKECLDYYLDVERESYRRRMPGKVSGEMSRLWAELEQAANAEPLAASA